MGFIIHDEKPVLDPTQKPKHIGFAFDFVSMTTSLTEKKKMIKKIEKFVYKIF